MRRTKKIDATGKRLRKEAHGMAKALYKVGAMPLINMREFDAACLPKIRPLSASKIKKIRRKAGVSQAVLAKILNISLATIKQWERGERHPSGTALKLLNLIDSKGIDVII